MSARPSVMNGTMAGKADMAEGSKKILVVEDEDALRTLVCRTLQGEYQVLEAAEAQTALSLVLQKRPDCIVMDLGLPNLSGLELCTLLAEINATKLIPVVVMTGQASQSAEELAKFVHVSGFLKKPFEFQELRDSIVAALGTKVPERRREWRVRLPIAMRIVGLDASGTAVDESIVTQDVSVGGFSCYTRLALPIGEWFDVWLVTPRPTKGTVAVVRVEHPGTPEQCYGFQFIHKPENWILR
jgi:CheY-like chemotaxis protein